MPDPSGSASARATASPAADAERDRALIGRSRFRLSASEGGLETQTALQIALGEHEMRRDLASGILRAFVIGNSAVWLLVLLLLATDILLMASGHETAAERIIDRGVVKTLVGATAVQVGIIMVAIAGNLFPRVQRDVGS